MRELRDAVRSLAADWRFTASAVALLGLTIGAATAIYALVHAVILQPLPFGQPDRVAVIWQRDLRRAMPVIEVSYGEALDWRRRSQSFDEMAVVGSVNWPLPLAGNESLSMAAVSASFFRVVGRQPAIGRAFEAADEQGPKPLVAVISHSLWTRRFGTATRDDRPDVAARHDCRPGQRVPDDRRRDARGVRLSSGHRPLDARRADGAHERGRVDRRRRRRRDEVVARVLRPRQAAAGRVGGQCRRRVVRRRARHRHAGRARTADQRGRDADSVVPAGAGRAGAVDAARRGRADAARRVRQRRRPAGVARGPARARAGHPTGARRTARPPGAAVGRRERADHGGGPGRRRRGESGVGARAAAPGAGGGAATRHREPARCTRPGLCGRRRVSDGTHLRPLARHRRGPARCAVGPGAWACDNGHAARPVRATARR